MRVALFGCGYVGVPLARSLARMGDEVWALTRNADRLAQLEEIPLERRICADLQSTDWHGSLGGDFDVVLNLVSSAGGGLAGYRLSYLDGNRSIATWATGRRVGRYIYTSATSVYPQTDGEWVSETDVPAIETLSASGQVLRTAELQVEAARIAPLTVVLRLGGIYGPGRHLYLDRLLQGAATIPGEGTDWLNLIHLDDILAALRRVMTEPLPVDRAFHLYNLVDNEPARKHAIADWLAVQLGVPPIPFDPNGATARTARRTVSGRLPNRRILNQAFREAFQWSPLYASYREGYRSILASLKR
jgi:nucleoside-diphosphate-sugar epimerase